MTNDPRIDAYIARMQPFAQPILRAIRERLHAATPGLGETIKWGMPFFTLGTRPFANMAAFKAHASFGFWRRDAAPTGREGKAMGQFGRLTTVDDVPDAAAFAALVAQQIALSGAPKQVRTAPKPELTVPPALAAALGADPVAASNFAAFPPSHRREYCEWIGEAKRETTRDARAAQAAAWIRDGKRRNCKYAGC